MYIHFGVTNFSYDFHWAKLRAHICIWTIAFNAFNGIKNPLTMQCLTCNAMVNLKIPLIHYDRCGTFFHSMYSYTHIPTHTHTQPHTHTQQIDLSSHLWRSIETVLFNSSLHLFGGFYHFTKIPPWIINGANATQQPESNFINYACNLVHFKWSS